MINKSTFLKVADNSGAKVVMCIGFFGGKMHASIGDVIMVSVKSAIPRGKVSKGKVYRAVIVRTRAPIRKKDGGVIRFSANAVVLINDSGEPIGTRVFGPIKKLSPGSFMKIMSLAAEVI